MKIQVAIFTVLLTCSLSAQTDKIKINKQTATPTFFKNDTCSFVINIDESISGKTLILLSIDINDGLESNIVQAPSFRRFISYIDKTHLVKPFTIKAMCIDVCRINSYRLKSVKVTEHKTTNDRHKNKFDIYLEYE